MDFSWQTDLVRGIGRLVDGYAPQRCLFCDQPSRRAEPLCDVCRKAFVPNAGACPGCALPDCAGAPCPACQRNALPLTIVAPFIYERSMAWLLQRWKYNGERRLVAAAALLATTPTLLETQRSDTLKEPEQAECDQPRRVVRGARDTLSAVVRGSGTQSLALATPLHWRRRLQRGFNQSEDLLLAARHRCPELGEAWARARGVRLRRRHATPRQARAARSDRLRNLRGAFLAEGDMSGRPILLVDDVCTTGATGVAMATALRDAGARSVTLWCLARTPER